MYVHFTPAARFHRAHSNLFPWRNSRRVAALIAPLGRAVVEEQTPATTRRERARGGGQRARRGTRFRSSRTSTSWFKKLSSWVVSFKIARRSRREEKKTPLPLPAHTPTPIPVRIFGIFVKWRTRLSSVNSRRAWRASARGFLLPFFFV